MEGSTEEGKRPLLLNNSVDHGQGSSTISTGYNSCDSSSSSITSAVVLSVFVLSSGSFAFGNILGYTSPAESGIMNELGLSLAEYSTFVSIYIIGTTFGAIWSGKAADVIGRRAAMGVTNVICIMGWLVISFAKGPWWLYLGRFLLGCGTGLVSYAGPVYMSEISPQNVRGIFMSVSTLPATFGRALFFLIGPVLSWRTLALIGVVPLLLATLGLLVIPESPRWLMKIGKIEESEKALQRFRGKKTDISQEIADIKVIP
ncbi:Major facilitator, sugar transporter-like [Parasponia andersonii]|uniref:Major facilitator, sugar transporter-like n=1 Tax=Parasponia andersonii TaxID=3476 RepID=A0A2P5CTK5_PARAD|nr:Major facilitator, sugar transporter-like [Parasponia andersonii]